MLHNQTKKYFSHREYHQQQLKLNNFQIKVQLLNYRIFKMYNSPPFLKENKLCIIFC